MALSVLGLSSAQGQILKTTVQQGEIEGVEHNGSALYMNIPYAEPPVGDMRWKAPVAKKAWEGVYKADHWGNRPPQPSRNSEGMGEDCLYLSVQTPAKSKEDKLPVFVMIHGGGYTTGSYTGTQDLFVSEGIVYCSIEYRLGALGFMAHPELSKESERGISGNYGILDQIMALQWIHDNIASFGGDPEHVTIAGESAGGISVSILCASPLCKGLFQAAICESGSSFWPVGEVRNNNTAMLTVKSEEVTGLNFQKELGAKNIKQFRKVPFEQIVEKTHTDQFWPIVDGYAITDDQYKLYEAGNYNDVNLLIGTNSDEGSMFVRPVSVEEYEATVRGTYGEFADRALKLYPASTEEETFYGLSDIFRDGTFAWGSYAWANLQKKTGKSKVFMYYFDQISGFNFGGVKPKGAGHASEMSFAYGYSWGPMSDMNKHMQQIMTRYWINFAKTGDPNGEALPYWPEYQQGESTVMIMKDGFTLGPVQNQEQMDFFEDFFKARRK